MKLIRILVIMAIIATAVITGSPPQGSVPHHNEITTKKVIHTIGAIDTSPLNRIAIKNLGDLGYSEYLVSSTTAAHRDPGRSQVAGDIAPTTGLADNVVTAALASHEDPGRKISTHIG